MNLKQLYDQTPVAKHHRITVAGDKVIVTNEDGSIDLYLMAGEGELSLAFSEKSIRGVLARIESKLTP